MRLKSLLAISLLAASALSILAVEQTDTNTVLLAFSSPGSGSLDPVFVPAADRVISVLATNSSVLLLQKALQRRDHAGVPRQPASWNAGTRCVPDATLCLHRGRARQTPR